MRGLAEVQGVVQLICGVLRKQYTDPHVFPPFLFLLSHFGTYRSSSLLRYIRRLTVSVRLAQGVGYQASGLTLQLGTRIRS